MRAASQIVLCASSFVVLLILGNFFDIAFWQARFHAEHLLGDKPLPQISQFFISHHHLPAHLSLLPWLALVGSPLLRSRAISYWEPQSFAFRYLAFLSAEMFAARLASENYATALKAFCRDLGYRLHVIVFIRPQAPLLNSLFTQHVKNWRLVDSIEAFLATETGNFRHHYAALLRHLLNDLGIDLTVLPFNRATLSGGLSTAMCQVMELDAAATGLVQPDGANPSPGPRTVAAFQRLRRKVSSEFPGLGQDQLAPLTRPLLHAAGALGWNAENFGGFSPSQTRWIIECFKSDNDALAQRVWSKPWDQVFSEAETLSPPFNIFSPADAPPPQRIEFRGFINQSMATIAEFGSTHHGHGKRM